MDVFLQNLHQNDWSQTSLSNTSHPEGTALILRNQPVHIFNSQNDSFTQLQVELKTNGDGGVNYDQVEVEEMYYPDYSQIPGIRNTFVFLFLVEFFVGVIGNVLVCLTVYQNKSMHSPVNYYIVNLGICDFIIGAFVLPTKLFELTAESDVNIMSNSWCTLIRFFESVVVFVSVLTLVTISVERYYAVCFPLHVRLHLIDDRIRMVLLFSWVIPIIVAAPNLYPAISTPQILYSEFGVFTRRTCFDTFSNTFRLWYFLFLFVFMYFLPLVFIVVTGFFIVRVLRRKIPIHPGRGSRAICLEQERQKVAKMMLVVVCAYILFWSPYFWVSLVTQLQSVNFFESGQFFFTMLTINLLCFTNSCVNPFVYFTMNGRFRKGIISVTRSLLCFWGRRARYSARSNVSTSSCRGASLRQVILEAPLRGHEMVHLNLNMNSRSDCTRASSPYRKHFHQERR